jgi:hypothetical protein
LRSALRDGQEEPRAGARCVSEGERQPLRSRHGDRERAPPQTARDERSGDEIRERREQAQALERCGDQRARAEDQDRRDLRCAAERSSRAQQPGGRGRCATAPSDESEQCRRDERELEADVEQEVRLAEQQRRSDEPERMQRIGAPADDCSEGGEAAGSARAQDRGARSAQEGVSREEDEERTGQGETPQAHAAQQSREAERENADVQSGQSEHVREPRTAELLALRRIETAAITEEKCGEQIPFRTPPGAETAPCVSAQLVGAALQPRRNARRRRHRLRGAKHLSPTMGSPRSCPALGRECGGIRARANRVETQDRVDAPPGRRQQPRLVATEDPPPARSDLDALAAHGQDVDDPVGAQGSRNTHSFPRAAGGTPPKEPEGRRDEKEGPSVPNGSRTRRQHAACGRHRTERRRMQGESHPEQDAPSPEGATSQHVGAERQEPRQGGRRIAPDDSRAQRTSTTRRLSVTFRWVMRTK